MSCRTLLCACCCCAALALVPHASMAAEDAAEGCLTASARLQEVSALDQDRLTRARPSKEPIPREVHEVLARLVRVARLPSSIRLRLVAVDGDRNAWVHPSGLVLLSANLWRGHHKLEPDEIAAVMAHEIAHLEAVDHLKRLCDTVALAGNSELSFGAATRAIREAILAGDRTLANQMMRRNHLREHRADRRGTVMLMAAGFRRDAMTRMLVKVAGGNGDYSATHPPLDRRLEALGYQLR